MTATFDQKLSAVTGTSRRIAIDDPHGRYSGGLLYYLAKSKSMRGSALALGGEPFGEHFDAFALLAGFSLEVLIKGTLLGLGEKVPLTHNLLKLVDQAGLTISSDDRAVLRALTIYTIWRSRYPAAKGKNEMIEDTEVLDSQYLHSGSLESIVSSACTSPRAVNTASYERLYDFFVQRFFDVQSRVFESAEFSFNIAPAAPT
ncbi:hypothetical protein [Ensifer sesbaniae]|uniref:hypothetical protein n=1 Tax=Ensifer sesbaniae TaxID=1214071 RepID=UPI001568A71C|nr:hypothetical protein [Ensifer sesbaniae]NRQ17683.1 hypothetical protein [Ensifer sesbaniae]